VEVLLTLTLRRRVKAASTEVYEEVRDDLIERFETNGWVVELEGEETSYDDEDEDAKSASDDDWAGEAEEDPPLDVDTSD
jgi:hypothetical protein